MGKSKAKRSYTLRKYCKFCGSDENLTIDHKHPKILGGTDEKHNLQTLCKKCNQLKSDIPNETFKRIMNHGIYCFIQRTKNRKWYYN